VNAAGAADADDPRLAPLTAVALDLPEAKRERGDRHATFRVRGRAFAYVLVDHHGDGIVGLVVKAPPAVAESLIDEEPDRFYRPAYVGHRGWVGLRLDAGEVDDDQVTGLVVESYRLCAPKSLARAIT
jgi:predicted DNA-binding protein (MmcQ/YjbR family)